MASTERADRADEASEPSELHEVDCSGPGIRRVRSGRGFRYAYPNGRPVRDKRVLARIKALAIPPAWRDVWICPDPLGHIQAVGVDDRGRRQYRYHDQWRAERDREKHDRAVELAKLLPRLREHVAADLQRDDLGRDRVLAAAVRLLERAFFRVGGEEYAEDNGSYGLATVQKRHVRITDGRLHFDYPAKSGQRRTITVDDPDLVPLIAALKRRRRGGRELLAYKDARGHWTDVRSADVNEYLRSIVGRDFSAKDLRTWAGTVLGALALAAEEPERDTEAARRRAVARAMRRVGEELGNTPQVARASYVDPRVIAQYEEGATVDVDLHDGAGTESEADADGDVLDLPDPADDEVHEAVIELIEGADEPDQRSRANQAPT